MRISTNTIYEAGITSVLQQQQANMKLQQQIATGRRVLTPSDDPIAIDADLHSGLLNAEQAFGDITRLLQDVKTLAINAGNPVLNNTDRAGLAAELEGRFQELLGIANRTDGNGQYLFSGYKGSTQPFSQTATGSVAYNGDEGQRLIHLSELGGGAALWSRVEPGEDATQAAALHMVAGGRGGTLVYCVCTPLPAEGVDIVEAAIADGLVRRFPVSPDEIPGFETSITGAGDVLTLPGPDGDHDTFYIARLVKA